MKKVFILSAITVLSLFTLVTQIASSQTSSSQNLNIVGAPQTGIDNTESEKTASAKAQEIAFEYLKCFVQKSFPAKDPLEIESGDLVACIISTNKDLSLSFNNDVVELTVAENAVFCNNLPIFTSKDRDKSLFVLIIQATKSPISRSDLLQEKMCFC